MFKLIAIFYSAIVLAQCNNLYVGQTYDVTGSVRKIHSKLVEDTGIPLLKREEDVFFEVPGGQRIKGIAVKDLAESSAVPSITRGGLGFEFVNVKLKSARGAGLKYAVEIYA